ncbi:UDP-N-acetylmuramate dehydrogenase [Flavobacterium jejuense]|uniref:UDP-N-acetylenolpyruvoylglucosamine reductase n=1 Tax=Flavobacterium jejuense TaxID=1544455 RepID=A0ABX0IR37_9FLAO|nr:UDP-N-acetylmuramate dehydrogenase [Flavobacterium jejuense]NHN25332.1 UDP-N-acetylmuramate dehydrogenase [Flavobacterium jejuense]
MIFETDFSLKKYNTFGIDAKAKQFKAIHSKEELANLLKNHDDIFILGGGSNMLLTKDIEKLVVHIDIKGIEVIDTNEDFVWIRANAGENWHHFVLYCIENGYGGIENLSLIPGNVGTTPIQNIGAYGVEIKDTFFSCEAMEIATQKLVTFNKENCAFGYRESVFKNELKNQYIITSVTFKLTKRNHLLNTSYGAIETELVSKNISLPTLKDISNAVINIRKSKLPDPKELGNSGSFFKNPIIPLTVYQKATIDYPKMPHYKVSETKVKVPAGWLIEQAGFKGKRFGDAGIHKDQALVLVNYGNATGEEILAISRDIQKTIFNKFGISIETEVNII